MHDARDEDELYQRGRYRLIRDARLDGTLRSPFYQIEWYDADRRRIRTKSTRTSDLEKAEEQLDILYVERERGQRICASCGQLIVSAPPHPVVDAVSNYLVARRKKSSYGSIKARLAHVTNYLIETDRLNATCDQVTEEWIDDFRDWAFEVPVVSTAGKVLGDRSAGTVEGSVRALSAAINYAKERGDTPYEAAFQAKKPEDVSETPAYRADVPKLAAMFRYCLTPPRERGISDKAYARQLAYRAALLRFLRVSVVTWCRPDAAYDVSTAPERRQWYPDIHALALNPRGREQTKKHRPVVPIARQFVPHLQETEGFYIGVDSIRTAFESMQDELRLPRDGETGQKLIRRSIAKLARSRLGEAQWIEGQMMLGHRVHSKTSDIYAAFEAGYLTNAKAVTEQIIDEIEAHVPGAFHLVRSNLRMVEGGRSA
tara:strand:- start:1471 stop:2757 length:1287 start_codon:yes stop_codon:yes gene_type:complete